MEQSEKTLDMIVNLCKNRGYVFPGSEIYGGLANSWDYGPLGVEFKNNVKKAWLKKFVQESPYNVGLDAAIIMNPQTWVTTGHVSSFSDPLLDCRACKARHRADKLIGEEHPEVNVDAMSFDEIEALKDEVNRISKDTEYNSKSLLDGSLDTRVYTDNANVSRVNVSDYVNPGKYEITIKQPAATKATDNATNVGIESTSTGTIDVSGTISINGYSVDIDKNDTKAEVYEKIRAAAEVGEAEMKTDDGRR